MTRLLLLSLTYLFLIHTHLAAQWGGKGIQGEGPVVRKTISIEPFRAFDLGISGDIILTRGARQQVEIEAQENVIANIKTEVRGGQWHIRYEERVREARPIKIYITLPSFESIGVSGSGSVQGNSRFTELKEIGITVSGSGDIDLDLQAEAVETRISGSGDVKLRGSSGALDIAISGSGDILAGDLQTGRCSVRISGSGDAVLRVDGDLNASISGSGDVRYTGDARVDARVSGSGNVRRM